jgi:CheY-like chemotaxis protein
MGMSTSLRLVSGAFSSDGANHKSGNGRSAQLGSGGDYKSTILVVEDETLIRLATADFLREAGYRVLEAGDASEAQVIIGSGEPIELVFSDINMPGALDGVELASWLAQRHPDVRIVLTSGIGHNAHRAAEVPSTVFIPKSYEDREVIRLFQSLLNMASRTK